MRKAHPPTYWFWLLEVSLERGDQEAVRRARRNLKRQGFLVQSCEPQQGEVSAPVHISEPLKKIEAEIDAAREKNGGRR